MQRAKKRLEGPFRVTKMREKRFGLPRVLRVDSTVGQFSRTMVMEDSRDPSDRDLERLLEGAPSLRVEVLPESY